MVVPINLGKNDDNKLTHRSHTSYLKSSKYNLRNDNEINEGLDPEEAVISNNKKDDDDGRKSVAVLNMADGNNNKGHINNQIKKQPIVKEEGNAVSHKLDSKSQCILLPHGEIRSSWDLYISILLIYVGTFVPYRVSFLADLDGIMEGVEIFVDASFAIDIILNFLTGMLLSLKKIIFM